MKKILNFLGFIAILGFMGGMDCGEPIGRNLLYMALTVLIMLLLNKKKNARHRAGTRRTGVSGIEKNSMSYYSTEYLKGQGVRG